MENDLSNRLFDFAVAIIKLMRKLDNDPEVKIIKYQLVKYSCSTGANYEESQGASSEADFINKVRISLKEMRESNYWLRLCKSTELCKPEMIPELDRLINESLELKKILGAIIVKTKSNQK